jgi:aminoglycoside N3'-acetyltransferase
MYPEKRLVKDLETLGIERGDLLFIHSSFKSLGDIDGGAYTVISALESVVGNSGLILMPSFNLIEWDKRHINWDITKSKSTVGWLTECFRKMDGTYRSNHYSHSVSARGIQAKKYVSRHLEKVGLKSRWDREESGFTFGTYSPMYQAYLNGGKLLMIGVDYESSTYVHLAEVIYRTTCLDSEDIHAHPFSNLTKVGEFWESVGEFNAGNVGDAVCKLYGIRQYVGTVSKEFSTNMDKYLDKML